MVAYIPWSRVANFIIEEQDLKMNVQTRFSRRPIGAGKSSKAPEKIPRYNSRLSNYRYNTVPAFHIRIWSSLYYPCLTIMPFNEIVHAVPIMLGHRLACHASLTLCLSFLCRYKCQYGLKDKSNEIVNVTLDMEHGPQKYNIKRKNIPNGRGKS